MQGTEINIESYDRAFMQIGMILFFLVVFLVVGVILYASRAKEGFLSGLSGSHATYVADSTKKLNELTNLVNMTNPSMPLDSVASNNMRQAIASVLPTPTKDAYQLSLDSVYAPPDSSPGTFQQASGCETAPPNCSAFDDPTFSANCGMSFDPNGTSMDGRIFQGGMYVSPDDRQQQMKRFATVESSGTAPYDPYLVAQPTIGKAKIGTFALNKGHCTVVKEKLDCAAKQTFNSPNCTQCYTSQRFSRVGPQTGRLPSILHLSGAGTITVTSGSGNISLTTSPLSKDKYIDLEIPADAEGSAFTISVGQHSRPYLAGFLEGPTARGPFKLDVISLISKDTNTGVKPRITGTITVGGMRCMTLSPGSGQSSMNLAAMMPFSFINAFDGDSLACENGPIITLAESATFLESDPCYGKANSPGAYKLECLQSRWMELGGTAEGTGYPWDANKANQLQHGPNGEALDIDTIVDILAVKALQAQTGNDANGNALSIPDWNAVSMYMTGVPINTPCDGPNNQAGPLSKACLAYLYTNQGINSRVGSTYTQNAGRVASTKEGFMDTDGEHFLGEQFKEPTAVIVPKDVMVQSSGFTNERFEDVPNTFNYPGTSLDPSTPSGLALGQSLGGVNAVKQKYDEINRLANDNTKTNMERSDALSKAYGVSLSPPSSNLTQGEPQVFAVGQDVGYAYGREQAADICAEFGAQVATTAQLDEAQKMGADWCFSAWVNDATTGKWPISTRAIGGCGDRVGIIEWTHPSGKAGVNCYGSKPDINDPKAKRILPFNEQMWDQPTEPTYLTIPSGYLETTGQNTCFTGMSVDAAQKTCDLMGSRCAGFSYSKDGKGNGCYKPSHNAGMNYNGDYMGYVKKGPNSATASVISGRYIKLEYNHVECLNLAQILVYAVKGGPNIITPSTKVTKPDGYQGDVFPVQNFVDGKGDTFVHTSCYSVPWIQVDLGRTTTIYKIVVWNRNECCQSRVLGTKLSIINEQQEVIYISDPVSSTNQTYTWLPPSPTILLDIAEDQKPRPPVPKTTPWQCLPSFGAPLRKNENGDVECMSVNAHDCMWEGPCDGLVRWGTNNPGVKPLTCGAMHLREWGGTGYAGEHWCNIGRGKINQ